MNFVALILAGYLLTLIQVNEFIFLAFIMIHFSYMEDGIIFHFLFSVFINNVSISDKQTWSVMG